MLVATPQNVIDDIKCIDFGQVTHYVIPCITNDISEWDSSDPEEPQLYIRVHGDVYLSPTITSYSVIENVEKLGTI